MKKVVFSILFVLSTIMLMSGCGGNSTSSSDVQAATLSGTAATGAPIEGIVTVKDATGNERDIATLADGSFTLDVAGMTPPYLLKIMPSDGTDTLYSFASQNGQVVNLTQITNLVIFIAAGKADLDAIYDAWDGAAVPATAIAAAESTVRANLLTQMTSAGLDAASYDLLTTPFSADTTGIDGIMDNLSITIDAIGGLFTFADRYGADMGFDAYARPPTAPVPANAISILTTSKAMHVLNGTYSSACYGSPDGQIDSLTVDGTTWKNSSAIYAGDETCSDTPSAVSVITATISKGADDDISGWTGNGDVSPKRAGSDIETDTLSYSEKVTRFNLAVTDVDDPAGVFGNVTPGFSTTAFYVFDDSAAPEFIMYRDDDGAYASASDPYITR